jgi:hypothetical protein
MPRYGVSLAGLPLLKEVTINVSDREEAVTTLHKNLVIPTKMPVGSLRH